MRRKIFWGSVENAAAIQKINYVLKGRNIWITNAMHWERRDEKLIKIQKYKDQTENILGRLRMRQRGKINYSHCRQFSTFRAGKYNYTQFTTAWEYLISTNITKDINYSIYKCFKIWNWSKHEFNYVWFATTLEYPPSLNMKTNSNLVHIIIWE